MLQLTRVQSSNKRHKGRRGRNEQESYRHQQRER